MLETSGLTTTLQEDENGNLILDFPSELLEVLGWAEGDTLEIQTMARRIVITQVSNSET